MRFLSKSVLIEAIREHIPLEQGLRLQIADYVGNVIARIREHIPLEQGLRQVRMFL